MGRHRGGLLASRFPSQHRQAVMKWILPLAAGLTLASGIAAADMAKSDALPAYVTSAVADPGRAADSKDDSRRHVAEIVAFSGVKPGDSVLELVPGTGYWS